MRREEPQTTRTHRGAGRISVLSLLVASCSFASSSEFDGLQKGLPDDSATDAGLTRDTGPIFFDAAAADDAGTEAEASVQGDASFQDGADASPTQSVFVFQQAVFPTTAYAGARDTTLVEQSPIDIRGGNTEIAIDHDDPTASGKSLVALMRFDLSAVPAGSKVTSASLTLNVTNPTDGTPYQVFPLLRAWVESEVNWVAATSSSAWASPGARGLGSDRQNIVLASLLPKATGSTTVTFDTVQLSIVESWIATPATNHGFVIDNQSNTDGLGFSSAEALSASDRPRFTLTVAPP